MGMPTVLPTGGFIDLEKSFWILWANIGTKRKQSYLLLGQADEQVIITPLLAQTPKPPL